MKDYGTPGESSMRISTTSPFRLLLVLGPVCLAAAILVTARSLEERRQTAISHPNSVIRAAEQTAFAAPPAVPAAPPASSGQAPAATPLQPLNSPPPVVRAGEAPVNLRRTVTVEVVEKTKDAVVYISTTKLVERRASPFGDPFWNFDRGIVKVPANSLGSGFIIHRDGYVVTNNHVIDHARQITVELLDGRKLPADLISADAEADVAILRIHSDKPFPALELGDSSDLMIGEPVIAVGNPMGYSHSVSTGIVSALHRDLNPDEQGHATLKDLIQTDAAINPGNSGGPLLNAYGQVIGINTAIRGDAQNIGFSIGINRLRDLIPDLMNPAQVTKVNVPLRLTEQRTLTPPANIRTAVLLAAKPGAAPAVVESIDGHRTSDLVDAYAQLLRVSAEDHSLTIKLADGKDMKVAVGPVPTPDAIVESRRRLGILVEQLTPIMAEKYHLASEDGLFVSEVTKNSIAEKAGIQPGDVIVQLGRYRVSTLSDLAAGLHRLPDSGKVRIGVIRGEQVGYGVLEF
jgi:serine protease Do